MPRNGASSSFAESAERAVVARRERGAIPVAAAEQVHVRCAVGVDALLLTLDVEPDVVDRDRPAVGRRLVPEGRARVQREDVGRLIGHLREPAEVGLQLARMRIGGLQDAAVDEAVNVLRVAIARPVRVPGVEAIDRQVAAHDPAGRGAQRRGLLGGLLLLRARLLSLRGGRRFLLFLLRRGRLVLLLGLLLLLLRRVVGFGIVVRAAADQRESGCAEADSGGGAQQTASTERASHSRELTAQRPLGSRGDELAREGGASARCLRYWRRLTRVAQGSVQCRRWFLRSCCRSSSKTFRP